MPPQFQKQFDPANRAPAPEKPAHRYGFLIILTVLLILTGIFGVWYFSNPLPEEETEIVALSNKFANWKTYKNEEYGFEFKYPEGWIPRFVKANEVGSNKASLVLENNYDSFSVMFNDFGDWGIVDKEYGTTTIMKKEVVRNTVTDCLTAGGLCGFFTSINLCYKNCTEYVQVGVMKIDIFHECITNDGFTSKNRCLNTFDSIASTFKFTK